MCRLAGAFAGHLCGKYQNLMSKLISSSDLICCACLPLFSPFVSAYGAGHLYFETIHVIRPDIFGTYRYWAPDVGTYRYWASKYESRLTDQNSQRDIHIVFSEHCRHLLYLNLQQEASVDLYWFSATGKSVCRLSSVNKNQHIFRHSIGCSGCT